MTISMNKLLTDLIEDYDSPFTSSEVHGFFTGLILLKKEKVYVDEKILSFLDISTHSLPACHILMEQLREDIKLNRYTLPIDDIKNFTETSSSMAEWSYYFMIAFQEANDGDVDPRIMEILEVFDEISQLNQKYVIDVDEEVNINSLYEIHNFIDKSVQYIFNKSND